MSSSKKSPKPQPQPKPLSPMYRWELLVLLFLAYFFHQSDRAIYGVVATSIQNEFSISDQTLYWTRTVMFTLMALVVPLAGFVGDKCNKRKLLISCLFCWSIATICTGCISGVIGMIVFNSIGVAVAEAFYGPASTSLIASYHKETRSIALSVHQTAVYLSVIFSGGVAGWISEHSPYQWRAAFWAFGGASIIIGFLLIFRLKDPAKVIFTGGAQVETAKPQEKATIPEFLAMIFRNPSALLLTIGFTAIVFVNNAYLNVVSKFLQEKFGCIYFGGWVSDRMSRKNPTFRPKLQFAAMAIGAPVVCLIGSVDKLPLVYALFFLMGVCRGFYECNTHASVFETIPIKYRSTTVGFMIMFAFLIGAWSSQMVGAFCDKFGVEQGYHLAFIALGCAWVVGAICVGTAAFGTFAKDRAKRLAAENVEPQAN